MKEREREREAERERERETERERERERQRERERGEPASDRANKEQRDKESLREKGNPSERMRESHTQFEHIELRAKLLDYFLQSNKNNINNILTSPLGALSKAHHMPRWHLPAHWTFLCSVKAHDRWSTERESARAREREGTQYVYRAGMQEGLCWGSI